MKITLKCAEGISNYERGTVREIGQDVPVRLQHSRPFVNFRRQGKWETVNLQ